jgi:hypothetical protein
MEETAAEEAAERAGERLPPGLLKALRADPDHGPELLMRYAVERLAVDADTWARRALELHPDAGPHGIAAEIRGRTNWSSVLAGAICGTPFFIALVPAYVSVLWDQAWMSLRIAALYGHDVLGPGMTAELLVLRGVHPTTAEAQAALDALQTKPDKRLTGGWRAWWALGRRFMVLAGFMDADQEGPAPSRLKEVVVFAFGAVLYAMTWILPLSFMIVMAQSCLVSTKKMGAAALARYAPAGSEPATRPPRRHRGRTVVLAALGGGIPIAFVVWADDISQNDPDTWVRGVGILFGLSLVLALLALSRRGPR